MSNSKNQIIGTIAFGRSPNEERGGTGTVLLSDEQRKRLLDVLAGMRDPARISPDADVRNVTIEKVPTRTGGHREMRKYDTYRLVGEDMHVLAGDVKSYAFAYALALRWSHLLGQSVKMMRRTTAATFECIETVDARDTSEGAHVSRQIHAEINRIQSARIAMQEVADDVRCMIEDADDAMSGLRALADINGVPGELVAQTARAAADHFDVLHWYTLINHNDNDMLGELLATDAA